MKNFKDRRISSSVALALHKKVAYIQYVPGHKDSKGEFSPWTIKDHKTNKVIRSYKTKEDAEVGLQQGHIFKSIEEKSATNDISQRCSVCKYFIYKKEEDLRDCSKKQEVVAKYGESQFLDWLSEKDKTNDCGFFEKVQVTKDDQGNTVVAANTLEYTVPKDIRTYDMESTKDVESKTSDVVKSSSKIFEILKNRDTYSEMGDWEFEEVTDVKEEDTDMDFETYQEFVSYLEESTEDLDGKYVFIKNASNVLKKADDGVKPEEKKDEPAKTTLKPYTNVLKDKVNVDVAVQPTEDISKLLQEVKQTQSRLVALDNLIKLAQAKFEEEKARIKTEGGQVENQTQLDNLVNLIAQMLEKANLQTVKYGDELVALYTDSKTVPFKASDKWKLDKLRERYKDADEYLEKAIQGAQSLATTENIRELVWVSPKKKAAESQSAVSILKDIYVGLKNFFIETIGVEEELQAITSTASKGSLPVEKKSMGMFNVGDPVTDKANQKGKVDKINEDGTLVVELEDGMFETCFEHELKKLESTTKYKGE